MHKKLVFTLLLLCIIPLASAADVAYILEDASSTSSKITSAFNSLGLTYDIIKDSQIASTDFSGYSFLFVAEDVTRKNLLPLDKKHAIFLDNEIADETWNLISIGQTTNKRIKVSDTTSFVFEGVTIPVNGELDVYSGAGGAVHSVTLSGNSGVKVAALRLRTSRPTLAHSFKTINGVPVKDFFLGLPEPDKWNSNAEKIFENSIVWVLGDIDQDGDGFPYGEDCNDNNILINPDADEIPYDGIDQDCSGFDLLDADGDGFCNQGAFPIQNTLFQCPLDTSTFGMDCNDQDSIINPNNPDPLSNCVNDAPEISEAPIFMLFFEGELVEFDVVASDPENDFLTYEIDSPDFTADEFGHYMWQTNYEDEGIYEFQITVSDSEFSDSASIQIEIVDQNQPPTFAPISSISWNEDSSTTIDLSDYFSDSDSDTLEFGIDSYSPNEIKIEMITDSIVELSAEPDFFGTGEVVFYAFDGISTSFSDYVPLEINSVNDPLTYQGTIPDLTWNEDNALEDVLDLNNYFKDIDSELTFTAIGNTNVEVTFSNGFASFYPAKDFAGTEEIYFTATDGEFSEDSNTLILTLLEQGEPPEFVLPLVCETEIDEDSEHNCELSATDFEGDEFTFLAESSENLNCEVSGSTLTYYSAENYNGLASCFLTVTDLSGSTETIFEVNVFPINDAPKIKSASPDTDTVNVIEGRSQLFSLLAEDPDSEVTVSWFYNDALDFETSNKESEFTFPGENQGSYLLEVIVSDSESSTNKLWNILVRPIEEFTCSEAGGFTCEDDRTCSGEVLGVKDSNACCATQCIPSFKDADSCEIIEQGLRVEIEEPEENQKIELGETIRLEFKIFNDLDEDQNVDVEAFLYDITKDNVEAELDTEVEIRDGGSRTVRLNMDIPEDLDLDNEFAIYVKVSDDVCNQNYKLLNLERPEENVVIDRFDLPSSAYCGELIDAEVRIENLGSDDQDVTISLYNSGLDIDEESNEFELDYFDGDENRATESFTFLIPEDTESGSYSIRAMAEYSNGIREVKNEEIDIICEKTEIVSGSTFQPEAIETKIQLNQIDSNTLNPETKQQSKKSYVPVAVLMMLNLILVAAGAVLYLVSTKKKVKVEKK